MGNKYSAPEIFVSHKKVHNIRFRQHSSTVFQSWTTLRAVTDAARHRCGVNGLRSEAELSKLIVEAFSFFPTSDAEELATKLDLEHYQPGDTIYSELEKAAAVYWILEGEIQLSSASEVIKKVQVGEVFGVTDALMGDTVSLLNRSLFTLTARVSRNLASVAVGGAVVLKLSADDYFDLVDRNKLVKHIFRDTMKATTSNFLLSIPLFSPFKYCIFKKLGTKPEMEEAKAAAKAFAVLRQIIRFQTILPGTILVKQGKSAECCFLLLSGKAISTFKDSNGFPTYLTTFSRKYSFANNGENVHHIGEASLISGSPAKHTTVVVEPSTCLAIDRLEFKALLEFLPSQYNFIRRWVNIMNYGLKLKPISSVLRHLKSAEDIVAGALMEATHYPAGQIVLLEGEKRQREKAFFIVDGHCEVIQNSNVVNVLHRGDYFGELSLFTGQPNSATIKVPKSCIQGLRVLTLDKIPFLNILGKNQLIQAECFFKYFGEATPTKYLLLHRKIKPMILDHSQKELSQENILFYQVVMELESLQTDVEYRYIHSTKLLRPEYRRHMMTALGYTLAEMESKVDGLVAKKCWSAYQRFIRDDAEFQINIPYTINEDIKIRLNNDDISTDMFDAAKQCIFELMDLDVMARFRKTAEFQEAVKRFTPYKFTPEVESFIYDVFINKVTL